MSQTIPILAFHAIEGTDSNICFPPAVFDQGLRLLSNGSFCALTMSQAAALLKSNTPWPAKSFVLTFDDGYQSVYEHAFPLLKELGFSATVFINTGPTNGPRLPDMLGHPRLSWAEIREMHTNGIEIGAHTVTHPNLTLLPPDQIELELTGNKAILEEFLGAKVTSFAYPFGFENRLARAAVARQFESACTGQLYLATGDSDPFALPRLEMHYFRSNASFQLLSSALLTPYLALRRMPRILRQVIRRAADVDSGGQLSC